ncbi:acylphosphatase [Sediminibacillus massiliensis]|uniref:acylphosphatase n=1 Tax=Sediminibacillus massiliensis TaxID=1926277 RepID=UPI001FEAFB34|nr:acylphosphatase [Sediminibacillus massiliensis]
MVSAHMVVSGSVQGVGFRASAQQKATELGVNGWVKNRTDGKVELEAEGSQIQIEKFIKTIKDGPNPFIEVKNMEITKSEQDNGYQTFKVVY